MPKRDKDMKRKMDLLKRTQEIDKKLNEGDIKSQALLDSTGESKAVDEAHAIDLMDIKQRSVERPIEPIARAKSPKSKKTSHSRKRKR